jgi:2-polyprenyl-6-methoxyphenol hydroxylase-like FAD-dependent oxidoreductase
LVSKGLIAKPIHVYEKSCLEQDHACIQTKGKINNHHHDIAGTGAVGREIGVGIWNTALEPFKKTNGRKSHLQLIERLEALGQYVGEVGYRTPKGKWLTKSKLRTEEIQASEPGDDRPCVSPSLLFVRERDFLSCLREAVQVEQETFGTIQMHHGRFKNDKSTCVQDIVLCGNNNDDDASTSITQNGSIHVDGLSGKLQFADGTMSENSYHFIIAADGMNSVLRTKYAGYDTFIQRWKSGNEAVSIYSDKWQREQMEEKHAIEDRKYVVFRGNSPLTNEQANMNGRSFQTWGEGRNMRFAAVGMSHPKCNGSLNAGERCEKQVWFATISDDELCSIEDPQKRKERLIENFQDWHEPICSLIASTPADEILMERGLGHKHSLLPVLNMAEVIQYQSRSKSANGSSTTRILPYQLGPGPILLFSGDSYMTIDPVLAQGFTMGMEGAADLASTLERCLQNRSIKDDGEDEGDNDNTFSRNTKVAFDPYVLRSAIMERNTRRFERVMCLIRSTELVQYMAQPTSMWASMLAKHILRPCMMIIPSSVKEIAFSAVMKYSLGYYNRGGNKLASAKTKEKGNQ